MSSNPNGDSEKYYTSSSSRKLPPIREVVGDVLQQPIINSVVDPRASSGYVTTTSESRRHSSIHMYSSDRYKPSSSSSQQSPTLLPPLRSITPSSYNRPSSLASSSYPQREDGRRYAQDYPQTSRVQRHSSSQHTHEDHHHTSSNTTPGSTSQSQHAYHVFVTSEQGLVHQRSSDRDDFRQVLKDEAISMSTGKHACPECGRRFEKLSHYKSHLTTHSGERPYQCPLPGCGKTFSASSNMRRHQRTHGAFQ